jgi:uncharacterized protein (DUF885 family)
MYRHAKISAVALLLAAPATAGPPEDLRTLMDDYWADQLKESPFTATLAGVRTYDRDLDEIDLPAMDRRAAKASAFLRRLEAIPPSGLSADDRTSQSVLRHVLRDAVDGNRFGQRQVLYSSIFAFHYSPFEFLANVPQKTAADFDNYLARLSLVPERLRSYGAISVKAAREGFSQPCVSMVGFETTISNMAATDPASSIFYRPFAGERPASIDASQWTSLQSRARQLIVDRINPAYHQLADLYAKDWKGRCLKDISVSAQPQGKEYYAHLVRQQTTTDLSPDKIHEIGLAEVARIRTEMDEVARKAGFASRQAMIADMRSNPKWFAKTPAELLEAATRQAREIDPKMPRLFGRLPKLTYEVREFPSATAEGNTTAAYEFGSPDAGKPGIYYVNTTHLDQRPLWALPSLTVHEAVPGHHQQVAIQQELQLPAWRKYLTSFNAFAEGWGLYSERLGIEMGLYDTPQKDMGRLSDEMWRAVRLVVDTGIHAKGWSKEQAVAFMKTNTALTDKNIDAEVNRYISYPAQALSYKIGELKIRELRTRAEKALADRFDLRAFHDTVLSQGPVPLKTLEEQVNAWIAREKASQ